MSTLVIAEHAAGRVGVTTLETITAAVELGEPVTLAVVASESPPAASLGKELTRSSTSVFHNKSSKATCTERPSTRLPWIANRMWSWRGSP